MNELGICEQDMYEQGMNEQEVNGQGISAVSYTHLTLPTNSRV